MNDVIRSAPFCTNLLMQVSINPMSPAQIHVIEAAFRGSDYVVKYLPRKAKAPSRANSNALHARYWSVLTSAGTGA